MIPVIPGPKRWDESGKMKIRPKAPMAFTEPWNRAEGHIDPVLSERYEDIVPRTMHERHIAIIPVNGKPG